MNKQELTECLLYAGFRILSVVLLILGSLGVLFQLADSWYRFDPNYLGPFLLATLLRPACLLVAGGVLFIGSGPAARRMAARFTS